MFSKQVNGPILCLKGDIIISVGRLRDIEWASIFDRFCQFLANEIIDCGYNVNLARIFYLKLVRIWRSIRYIVELGID